MQKEARVIEVFHVASRLVLKIELVSGELSVGDCLRSTLGNEIEVVGVAFPPPDAWHAGLRLATVRLVRGDEPKVGEMFAGL